VAQVLPNATAREKSIYLKQSRARFAELEVKENALFGRLNKGLIAAVVVILVVNTFPGAGFAQVRVILSNGFGAAYREAIPDFEKTSGIKVTTSTGASQGNGPNTIGAQLRRGEPADVVIMNKAGLDALIAEGKIAAETNVDLARTLLAVAIRSGAPKPDISTLDAFKKTLLGARSVSVDASTSGIYLTTKAFPRLGIARELQGKTIKEGARGVASGKADIAVMLVSEILPVKGVEVAAPVPAEIQEASVFSAAVVAGATEVESAKLLIAFLASQSASAAIKHSGMEPLNRR
jgi:molybdate transport system substrate-binding protein